MDSGKGTRNTSINREIPRKAFKKKRQNGFRMPNKSLDENRLKFCEATYKHYWAELNFLKYFRILNVWKWHQGTQRFFLFYSSRIFQKIINGAKLFSFDGTDDSHEISARLLLPFSRYLFIFKKWYWHIQIYQLHSTIKSLSNLCPLRKMYENKRYFVRNCTFNGGLWFKSYWFNILFKKCTFWMANEIHVKFFIFILRTILLELAFSFFQ